MQREGGELSSLTPQDHEAIEEIVERTVEKTLAKFGVDVSTPEKVVHLQDDLRYLRDWRYSMRTVRNAGLTAAIGTLVTGAIAAVVLGISQAMRGG